MSFSLDLSMFADKSEAKMKSIAKNAFIKVSNDVINDTPVDSGRARSNWLPDINKFNDTVNISYDRSGRGSIAKVQAVAAKVVLGDTMTLVNNLDYIDDLEYGKYPNPPKNGGLNSEGKPKTVGGYSSQAPEGFLRRNLTKHQKYVREQARKG